MDPHRRIDKLSADLIDFQDRLQQVPFAPSFLCVPPRPLR